MKLLRILLCLAPIMVVAQQPQGPLSAPNQLPVVSLGPPANLSSRPLPPLREETLEFRWDAVPQAAAYAIEIDCYGCCAKRRWCSDADHRTFITWMIRSNNYRYSLGLEQYGSWRIWAIDKAGQSGQVSPWSVFSVPLDPNAVLPARPKKDVPPRALPFPIVMQYAHPVDPITGEACTWPATQPKGPGITQAKGIYLPDPEYGDSSRRWGVNGRVTLVVHIGTDGRVQRACLLDAVQPDLGEQSVKAVREWRFEPARKDGVEIPSIATIETDFTLYPWPHR